MIFITFSFITLLALLYYIFGLVTYQGACAPLRERDSNVIFRQLDTSINLSKYTDEKPIDESAPTLRMSTAIKSCTENMTIFDILHKDKAYDIEDLVKIEIFPNDAAINRDIEFQGDLSKVILLKDDEKIALQDLTSTNLSDYHSVRYTEVMCAKISPDLNLFSTQIKKFIEATQEVKKEFYLSPSTLTKITMRLLSEDVYFFRYFYEYKILNYQRRMEENLLKIDDLILYENREFKDTINVLVNAINRAENFLKTRGNEYINTLAGNLTDVIQEQMDIYVQGIIHECLYNVGACKPLSYIYYRGVDQICYRLIDPLVSISKVIIFFYYI